MSNAEARLLRLACKVSILGYGQRSEQVPNCLAPSRSDIDGYTLLTPSIHDWPLTVQAPELGAHNVHVWSVSLDVPPSAYHELFGVLARDERERAGQFRVEPPRRQFVVARGTLRRLLGQYLSIQPEAVELAVDENNKPRLAGQNAASGLHFNVSHSGALALIAIARGCEIGVDIERIRDVRDLEQIARRFFHPAEAQAVLSERADLQTSAFFHCWTAKEAVLKAIGVGLLGPLTGFQAPIFEPEFSWLEFRLNRFEEHTRRCWLQRLAPPEGYIAALATVDSPRQLRCFTHCIARNNG